MADDVATTDSPASIDIGATLGGAVPQGLQDSMTSLRRDQSAETDKVTGKIDKDIDADQDRIHRWQAATEASGIEAAQYPKWNADEQQKKFSHDPIEAFGSLGSVVGILASAFTHAPMENAFNASAAAMNAIKAGDDQGYERAHQAWKENLDLTFKRHDLMHSEYQDATTLMQTDMKAGEAKLKTAAARYGDKKLLLMAESGMDADIFQVIESRNKAIEGLRKINLDGIEDTMKAKAYDGIAKGIDQAAEQAKVQGGQVDPTELAGRKLQAFNRIYKADKETPAQQIMGTFFAQHPLATAEEAAKFATDNGVIHKYTPSTDAEIIAALKDEHKQAGKAEPTAQEIAEAISKKKPASGAGGNANLTVQRQNAAAADAYAKKLRDDNPTMSEEEVQTKRAEHYAQLNAKSSSASGNQIDWMKGQRGRIAEVKDRIDEAEQLLKKHKALTGLGGTITRPGEIVENWFGSNQTDRARFQSIIAEIKEFAPRLLNESKGRPLASEAENVDKIVRGTKAGDTTANTARQLLEVKKTLERFDGLLQQRIDGGGTNAPAATEKPASSGKKPWDSAPIVKPRAELQTDDQAA